MSSTFFDDRHLNIIADAVERGATLDNEEETGVWYYLSALDDKLKQARRRQEVINWVDILITLEVPTFVISALIKKYSSADYGAAHYNTITDMGIRYE